jgi:hypothetical protein
MQPDNRPTCPECGKTAQQDQVDITRFEDMARGEIVTMPGHWRCLTAGCPNGPSELTVYPNAPRDAME